MPVFWGTLDVVCGLDDSDIQILSRRMIKDPKKSDTKFESDPHYSMTGKRKTGFDRELVRRPYSKVAVDVGEADFGAILESAIGFSPCLERPHFCNFPAKIAPSLSLSLRLALRRSLWRLRGQQSLFLLSAVSLSKDLKFSGGWIW